MNKISKSCRAHHISWEHAQALLASSGCTKDTELSQKVRRPVYQLPNGNVLLPLEDDIGVVYESREQLTSIFENTSEPPLEQRRGIEHIDLNDYLIFCHAPIEQVEAAFSQIRQVVDWERDAYGREIEISGQSFAIFQFRGHSWNAIHELNFLPGTLPLGGEDEIKLLSSLLQTKAIEYQISDTGGNIGYKLYEFGELTESLYFSSDSGGTYQFDSKKRQLETKYPAIDVYHFTYTFMEEQDVYVPAFSWKNLKKRKRVTLNFQGYNYDDFERFDCCRTAPKYIG
ncbi:MAG: hypothetical protein JOZ78_16870 [Chroococcidiopsidaceae cyanobacterium CP_BM_ER_R8_30]|nr:hypothetical protein [Chroococcidiopsidaceae cyanobacterium CP_BM_ER_R8_30]